MTRYPQEEIEMTLTATKTVGEIAAETPSATREFEKLGIDDCCGGNRTLGVGGKGYKVRLVPPESCKNAFSASQDVNLHRAGFLGRDRPILSLSSDFEPQRPESVLVDAGAFRGSAWRRLEAIEFDNPPALEPTLPQTRRDGGKVHHAVADFAEAGLQFY